MRIFVLTFQNRTLKYCPKGVQSIILLKSLRKMNLCCEMFSFKSLYHHVFCCSKLSTFNFFFTHYRLSNFIQNWETSSKRFQLLYTMAMATMTILKFDRSYEMFDLSIFWVVWSHHGGRPLTSGGALTFLLSYSEWFYWDCFDLLSCFLFLN